MGTSDSLFVLATISKQNCTCGTIHEMTARQVCLFGFCCVLRVRMLWAFCVYVCLMNECQDRPYIAIVHDKSILADATRLKRNYITTRASAEKIYIRYTTLKASIVIVFIVNIIVRQYCFATTPSRCNPIRIRSFSNEFCLFSWSLLVSLQCAWAFHFG